MKTISITSKVLKAQKPSSISVSKAIKQAAINFERAYFLGVPIQLGDWDYDIEDNLWTHRLCYRSSRENLVFILEVPHLAICAKCELKVPEQYRMLVSLQRLKNSR